MGELTGSNLNGNGIAAMRTGIFNLDDLIGLAGAVDQQQEVDGSPNIEYGLALHGNSMEVVAQWPAPLFSALR